jgi:hypothetical protein
MEAITKFRWTVFSNLKDSIYGATFKDGDSLVASEKKVVQKC